MIPNRSFTLHIPQPLNLKKPCTSSQPTDLFLRALIQFSPEFLFQNFQQNEKKEIDQNLLEPHQTVIIEEELIIPNKKPFAQGCRCKKTHCQTKQCRCLLQGIICSQRCKCLECCNEGIKKEQKLEEKEKKLMIKISRNILL